MKYVHGVKVSRGSIPDLVVIVVLGAFIVGAVLWFATLVESAYSLSGLFVKDVPPTTQTLVVDPHSELGDPIIGTSEHVQTTAPSSVLRGQ